VVTDQGAVTGAAPLEAPIYGRLGHLAVEDDRLQCHLCGRWFVLLGAHAWHTHGLLAREYRRQFGLRASTALASASFRARKREQAALIFSGHTAGQERLRRLTTDQRRALATGRTWPLEALQDPEHPARRQAAARQAGATLRARHRAGTWAPPRPRDPSAAGQRGNDRKRELLQDPAYRAWFGQRVSAGQGGRKERPCTVCGRPFWARSSRRTCSAACEHTSRVRTGVLTARRRCLRATVAAAAADVGSYRRTGPGRMTDVSRSPTPREAAAEIVLALVATLAGVERAALVGPGRAEAVACPRRAAAALLQTDVGLSARRNGELLGRSAATIRYLSGTAAHDQCAGELMARVRAALRIFGGEDPEPDAWTPRPVPTLAACRRAAGLSQPALARRAGMARETLSRIEHGRRAAPDTISRLAAALALPVGALMEDAGAVAPQARTEGRTGAAGSGSDQPSTRQALPGLASCRRRAGLSQDELARRAGLARETIIRLERGRSAWAATVRRLARALGVLPGTLTAQPDTNPPDPAA